MNEKCHQIEVLPFIRLKINEIKIKDKYFKSDLMPYLLYDTFMESLEQDLSNPAYIGLISGAILTPHP